MDFDRVREGTHSSNPLLSMFSGVHEVVVVAHAHGAGGQGYVHVDSVALDGVEIPQFVLELFVEKFLHAQVSADRPGLAIHASPTAIDTVTQSSRPATSCTVAGQKIALRREWAGFRVVVSCNRSPMQRYEYRNIAPTPPAEKAFLEWIEQLDAAFQQS